MTEKLSPSRNERAARYLKAMCESFGPDEGLDLTQETWSHARQHILALLQSETACSADELKRLRDIEHYAWHLMDGSEEDAQTGEVTIRPMREDYDTLSKLLPEAHP